MRVAIVHDYLIQFGGAERVLRALMDMFPTATIFTLLHDPRVTEGIIDPQRIRTSLLQRIPFARSRHRLFPLVMPFVVEQFNLSRFDLVISASHSFGKGVLTHPGTTHISYCFTPMRYAWDDSHRYIREFTVAGWARTVIPFALAYVRVWDALAADRVDHFLAISRYVSSRIQKYYGRSSEVVYPPVDCSRFTHRASSSGRFLIVSRLLPYKRIDVAIEAFNALKLPLDIVGAGPEEERLRALAGSTIRLHGFLPDAAVNHLLSSCEALIFPQEEDFGITPLEAAAAGRPTIAYAGGGALETVIDGETGVFFAPQTVAALGEAVERFKRQNFSPERIRAHALTFDTPKFQSSFLRSIQPYMRAEHSVSSLPSLA